MTEIKKQPEVTPESVGILAALAELAESGYDPISDAEEAGREAYFNGYSLSDALESQGINTDTDEGMAFVVAFRNAASEPPRQG